MRDSQLTEQPKDYNLTYEPSNSTSHCFPGNAATESFNKFRKQQMIVHSNYLGNHIDDKMK